MLKFFLLLIVSIFSNAKAWSDAPSDFTTYDCESAFRTGMHITLFNDGAGFISWLHKDWPNSDPLSRNTSTSYNLEKDIMLFQFEDGAVALDAALVRKEILSSWASARFLNGVSERYSCLRIK